MGTGNRMDAILRRLASLEADGTGTVRLCQLAGEITGVSGASILLLSDDLVRGSLCTTDGVAAHLDDLQLTLGEGPALDAHATGRPVLEPDLASPVEHRWPVLTEPAIGAGVRAVFSFPARIGTVRLGALTLHRGVAGPLSDEQFAQAQTMALVATRTILAMQADAPPGTVATELEDGANFHLVVHQAAGMVSVQLGIGVTEALVRLRGHAFLAGRTLDAVSRDIVDRVLRLDVT